MSSTISHPSVLVFAECWGPDPYCTPASDVWAVGVVLANMVSCASPWEKASLKDRCFARYVRNPKYLYNAMPISEGLYTILRRTLALDPLRRLTLPKLGQMVLSLDTFFRSGDEKSAVAKKCFKEPPVPHPQPRATCSNLPVKKLPPSQLVITEHRSLSPSISSISSVPSMSSSDSSEDWEDESTDFPEETSSSWTESAPIAALNSRKGSMALIMTLADDWCS